MSDCPLGEELREFLGASLPEGRASSVRAHVLSCSRCQDELDRLTDSETLDEWRPAARAAGLGAVDEEEPSLSRLRRALRDALPGSTIDDDTAADPMADGWRTLLRPPGRPGDLGTLGTYLVEAEVGRGGMGIVLRAFDPSLGRRVALKVLRPDRAQPQSRRRLVREARAAALCRHDHLVAVYAVVDPPDGVPYLVMEYLDGPTLGRLIEPGAGMEPRRAALLIAQVADGLAAAHDAGLVHRDIKPENIMIDPPTGRAKLMDFGLARDEAGGESLTRDGILAGTPTHMSPEQARGLEPDRRSDVYSLGVTLYECLTGEVPFRGAPHMVIRQVCEDDPRPPRRLNDRIPRDLETICMKAMAREPATRYPSARDLGDDLRRWLDGESIKARPPGPIGRAARWCRRNARLAALLAVVAGLLTVLVAVSWVAAARIAREQRERLRIETNRRHEAELAAARIAREQERTLTERQAARDHYRLALETLNLLVLDVNNKLGTRPGTLQLKRDILETARAGVEKIARSSEAEGATDRSAVIAYDQLGGVLFALGRTPEAIRAYERSRDLAEALLKTDPDSVQVYRDLAKAHDQLGEMSRYGNDIPAAEASFRRAIAVRQALIARHGYYPEVLRDLCVSSNKIGLIHLRRGEYAAAAAEFTRSLGLVEQYAHTYSSPNVVTADYEYIYRHLGQCCLTSDWKMGIEYDRKALEKARAFVAAEPENLWLRKKLGIDLDQLGNGLLLVGDPDGAQACFLEAQRIRQDDLAAEPGDVENRRGAGVSYQMLGTVARYRGDFDGARRFYSECLAICEALAESDPGSAQKQADVLENAVLLIDVADRAGHYAEALERVKAIGQRLDRLEREGRLSRAMIDPTRGLVGMLRPLYQAAAGGIRWDAPEPPDVPGLPAEQRSVWRLMYAAGMARRGRHAEAARLARDVVDHDRANLIKQRYGGRILGLCAAAVGPGKPDDALSPEDRRTRQSYIDAASEAVRRALHLSPETAFDLLADPDLDMLRRRGVLEALARELGKPTPAGTARP